MSAEDALLVITAFKSWLQKILRQLKGLLLKLSGKNADCCTSVIGKCCPKEPVKQSAAMNVVPAYDCFIDALEMWNSLSILWFGDAWPQTSYTLQPYMWRILFGGDFGCVLHICLAVAKFATAKLVKGQPGNLAMLWYGETCRACPTAASLLCVQTCWKEVSSQSLEIDSVVSEYRLDDFSPGVYSETAEELLQTRQQAGRI